MKYLFIVTALLVVTASTFSCSKADNGESTSLNLGADTTILDNEVLILKSNIDAAAYEWSTGEKTKEITINKEGEFWLKVTLENNETLADTINVSVAWRMVSISTAHGDILLWLHEETPKHKAKFLELVNDGYFNDQSFNRVINHFVIQGGCPDIEGGFNDTSLFIEPEFHDHLSHIGGALGGGRDDNPGKKTNACQFYIVDYSNNEPKYLDGDYTIFGQVVNGKETVDAISVAKTNRKDKPIETINIKAKMVSFTRAELLELFDFEVPS
ncbi:MAG: peptidylprolyl isomerase [Bacteroidia bacterium]